MASKMKILIGKCVVRGTLGIFLSMLLQAQTGCAAMNNQNVLKFKKHNITTRCYGASHARIVYAGLPHTPCGEKLAREKTLEDDKGYHGNTSGIYSAFVDPIQVEWRSRDGVSHSQILNLDDIFKEKIVLHKEDMDRVYKPMPLSGGYPTITIEVNDRTLSVYMDVYIIILPPDLNSNKRAGVLNRTLAYTNTF